MKVCSKCKNQLELTFFYGKQDNYSSQCKSCLSTANRTRYSKKHIEIKQKTLQYYNDNKSDVLKKEKEKRQNLTEEQKNKTSEYQREYKKKHKEQIAKTRKKWYQETQAERRAYSRKYIKQWNQDNKHIVLWCTLLTTCFTRLKTNKTDTTYNQLQYSHQELKQHIEKHFTSEMTWENHGTYWNAHHNIPVTWFKPDTPAHIVSGLSNIYPLDKKTNFSVGNKKIHFPVVEEYKQKAEKWLYEEFKPILNRNENSYG